MKKIRLQVWGRVQGVGFRYLTKMVADQLNIAGIVRNEHDGSVYIEANGDPEAVDAFVAKIKASPSPSGRVDRWELNENPVQETHDKFRVTN